MPPPPCINETAGEDGTREGVNGEAGEDEEDEDDEEVGEADDRGDV